jgi:hypothetical protein
MSTEARNSSVAYYWHEKGDPTRFIGWSNKCCQHEWPDFYRAWQEYRYAERVLNLIVKGEG